MSGIIDTNILLYAANRDAEEHPRAVAFLRKAASSHEQWYLTEGIVYEFLRVATHPRVFDRPLSWKEALQFLSPFLQSPAFDILPAGEYHWPVLEELLGELTRPAGNLFFDIRTVVLMREHGVHRIYTMDSDFLQFSGIEVIDPLKQAPARR
jgi:toxin-antitoxin system PIN domain toxin